MSQTSRSSQTSFTQSARYLLLMRGAIVLSEFVVLAFGVHLSLFTAVAPAVATGTCQMLAALLVWAWLRRVPSGSAWPLTLSLLADIALLGLWLHFTGGYTNPLTSLLLLPLAMAIILVPMVHSLVIAGVGIAVYRLLMSWYLPVRMRSPDEMHLEQLHLQGMWVAFMLTAVVLLLVVGTLVRRLRAQQAALAQVREDRLRDEQIIALGLSAATVAHRLGTPLNTIQLLVDEMRKGPTQDGLANNLALVKDQVRICSTHLSQLSDAAAQVHASKLHSVPLVAWLAQLRESATLLWPESNICWSETCGSENVVVDATLDQAVLNLIGNALRASPSYVHISARRDDDEHVALVIVDKGPGLGNTDPDRAFTQSEDGLGIGLFLSNATIQRLGGELRASVDGSGTEMTIMLPAKQHV